MALLTGRSDGKAETHSSIGHPHVIGEQCAEVGTKQLSRREVDGIEAAQHGRGCECRGSVEHIHVKRDQMDEGELSPRVCDCRRAASQHAAHNLHARQVARHALIRAVPAEILAEGFTFGFAQGLREPHAPNLS